MKLQNYSPICQYSFHTHFRQFIIINQIFYYHLVYLNSVFIIFDNIIDGQIPMHNLILTFQINQLCQEIFQLFSEVTVFQMNLKKSLQKVKLFEIKQILLQHHYYNSFYMIKCIFQVIIQNSTMYHSSNNNQMYIGSLVGYFYTRKYFVFDKKSPYLTLKKGNYIKYQNYQNGDLFLNLTLQRSQTSNSQQVSDDSSQQEIIENECTYLINKYLKTKPIKKNKKSLHINKKTINQHQQNEFQQQIKSYQINQNQIQNQHQSSQNKIDLKNTMKNQNDYYIDIQQQYLDPQDQQESMLQQPNIQHQKHNSQILNKIIHQQNIPLLKQQKQMGHSIQNFLHQNSQQQQFSNNLEQQKNSNNYSKSCINQEQQGINFNVMFEPLWELLLQNHNLVKLSFKMIDQPKKDQTGDQTSYYVPIRIDIIFNKAILNQNAIVDNNNINYQCVTNQLQFINKQLYRLKKIIQKMKKDFIKKVKPLLFNKQQYGKAVYGIFIQNKDASCLYDIYKKNDQNQINQINTIKQLIQNKQLFYFDDNIKMIQIKLQQKQLQQTKNIFQSKIQKQRNIRFFLIYLINVLQVKKINHTFLKPRASINSFIKWFRKISIGLNQKSKKFKQRYEQYMKRFLRVTTLKPIATKKSQQSYYKNIQDIIKNWKVNKGNDQNLQNLYYNQCIKQNFQTINLQHSDQTKKIHRMLGIHQNQQNQYHEIKNLNLSIVNQFEYENRHFKSHPNPELLKCQLKPYQKQGLQWMKFREGKLCFKDLFEEQYLNKMQESTFQRKLSPFWQQIELLNGQRLYINYITGQMTQIFHEWGSIKGGILADQMGLGKTIMMLGLMADDQMKGINLIVVPVSVLNQWKLEIRKFISGNITIYDYHKKKQRRGQDLQNYNVIITTYQTLANQYKQHIQQSNNNNNNNNRSFLFNYTFRRIILDEAHTIRNPETLLSLATQFLKAEFKWCLTGTLIQNSIEDLYGIFRFLNLQILSEQHWWKDYILRSDSHQQMLHTIYTVLRPVLLRRTKFSLDENNEIILELPPKQQKIIYLQFNQKQKKIYKLLQQGCEVYIKQQKRSYQCIFSILFRLRQFCCHPGLVFNKSTNDINDQDVNKVCKQFTQNLNSNDRQQLQRNIYVQQFDDEKCSRCSLKIQLGKMFANCGHLYCEQCLEKQINEDNFCVVCKRILTSKPVNRNNQQRKKRKDIILNSKSCKTEGVLKKIRQIYEKKQKCVIFTHYLMFIDLIKNFLKQKSIKHTWIKGSMSITERAAAVQQFQQNSNCYFLIISITAGGTGLNLTMANNVMICDLWWNPAIQDQAACRVHRYGQNKTVNVYKFVIKQSLEQKILKLHQKKRKLAKEVMMMKIYQQQQERQFVRQLVGQIS